MSKRTRARMRRDRCVPTDPERAWCVMFAAGGLRRSNPGQDRDGGGGDGAGERERDRERDRERQTEREETATPP